MSTRSTTRPAIVTARTHARIGLLGNPSDGYYGKVLALSLQNFYAEVTLVPADRISFQPHPVFDSNSFASLEELDRKVESEGFYGGVRLMMAAARRFFTYCREHSISLDGARGFTMSYDTTVPRQSGLAGSSAIITAALTTLMRFFGVESDIPAQDRPGIVLGAEADLGIQAGLQDRVIQAHGGVVFMDFEEAHMRRTGRGRYSRVDPASLPRLHVVWANSPSDSGRVHSGVRQRWLDGEREVHSGMAELASLAQAGREALQGGHPQRLGALMDRNFDIRRQLFGAAALGEVNLGMIRLARQHGLPAKFTGSGGAIVVLCETDEALEALQGACRDNQLSVEEVRIAPAICPLEGEEWD
mmetsp:Transcript_38945/g.97841  ORF Transcript_38945/g.97841 Transcript_38945/m.97841 type:complete len:358 (+) Transcript_38945:256-1329(+)